MNKFSKASVTILGLFFVLLIGWGQFALANDDSTTIPSTEEIGIEQGDLQDEDGAAVAEGMNSEGTGAMELSASPEANPNGGGAIYYRRIAGISFVPRDSDQTHDYANSGCIQGKAIGTGLWSYPLHLPQNSTILELTGYFYDNNNGANGTAWVTRFDQQGGTLDVASVSSLDTGGFGNNTVTMSHVIDNESYAYVAYVRPGTNDSTMRACGVGVRYQLDISLINLPTIMNMAVGE